MHFECLCEQIIEVHLVGLVDARDGDGAAVAGFAGARGLTLLFLAGTVSLHGGGCLSLCIGHFCALPVLEGWVRGREIGHPSAWMLDNLPVDTVFVIFLLVGVQEEIQTGEVAERDEFSERGALFVPQ